MKKAGKHIIWWLFIIVLVVPVIQRHFPFAEGKGLEGYDPPIDTVPLTDTAWFGGSFQKNQEELATREIGFHADMVRLRNQIDYSLFGILHIENATEGKDGYFFRKSSYSGYNGAYFDGKSKALAEAVKVKWLQEELDKRGKTLLICIAPGKLHYFNEFADPELIRTDTPNTHYTIYRHYYDELDVRHTDMNEWFLELKDTTSTPLLSKGGVHWTMYGSAIAMDSLMDIMHQELGPGNWLKMDVNGPEQVDVYPYFDRDITNALNLIVDPDELELRYPKMTFAEDTTGMRRPKVFIIGDSFVHALLWGNILSKTVSKSSQFWYYNKQAYFLNKHERPMVDGLDLGATIDTSEVILMLYTTNNLYRQYSGFVDSALQILLPQENFLFDSINAWHVTTSFDSLGPVYTCTPGSEFWLRQKNATFSKADRYVSLRSDRLNPPVLVLNGNKLEHYQTAAMGENGFIHQFKLGDAVQAKNNIFEVLEPRSRLDEQIVIWEILKSAEPKPIESSPPASPQ